MDERQLVPIIEIIRSSFEEFGWLLTHIRNNHGQLKLPKHFIRLLAKDGQQCWSVLYERPEVLSHLPLLALKEIDALDEYIDEFNDLLKSLSSMGKEELTEFKEEFGHSLEAETDELLSEFYSEKPISLSEFREFKRGLEGDRKEEFQKIVNFYFFLASYIAAQSFQLVALTSYGKSMCALVSAAKRSDNISFCRAVSIDRTTLIGIPYFQKKLMSLQLGNEPALYKNFLRAFSTSTLPNKILYPELKIFFSILHDCNFLTKLSNSKLLEFCEDLGIYSTFDKGNFDKIKTRFLNDQGHQF